MKINLTTDDVHVICTYLMPALKKYEDNYLPGEEPERAKN